MSKLFTHKSIKDTGFIDTVDLSVGVPCNETEIEYRVRCQNGPVLIRQMTEKEKIKYGPPHKEVVVRPDWTPLEAVQKTRERYENRSQERRGA